MATSAVFDMIAYGVLFVTPSRGITFINLAAERFLRISKADAFGKIRNAIHMHKFEPNGVFT